MIWERNMISNYVISMENKTLTSRVFPTPLGLFIT